MEMVHRGHVQILDSCAAYVSSVPDPFHRFRPDRGITGSIMVTFLKNGDLFSHQPVLLVDSAFGRPQRMQQHLRYSRKFGAAGCLAQLREFFEPLTTPVQLTTGCAADHRQPAHDQ